MTGSAENTPELLQGQTVWERFLGPGAVNTLYHTGFNEALLGVLKRPPRRVLELGCSAGRLGQALKEKFPGVHVTGIEMDPVAAQIARTHLDKIIEAKLEDIDFAAEGIAPGSIDTFIAGDVLEHLYDPWRALVRVRPLLTPDAQLSVSIPNIRNIAVHVALHNEGTWRYEGHGLLDITHIRFFTLRDIVQMMNETGYDIEDVRSLIDGRYHEFFLANRENPSVTIQVGKLKLENLAPPELQEYCTKQFVVLARLRASAANDAAG
jgi:2-polyprenyl-3-methyl-5-hydroxy-6-metoxy-1,4-benzoquinol methylase